MGITDELRKWAEDNTLQDMVLTTYPPQHAVHGVLETLLRIADRIDAEHERVRAESIIDMTDESMAEHGWVRLPKDADGEYIRIGDVMEYGKAHGRVIALMLSNYPKKWGGALHWGIQLEGEQAPTALDGFFRHYHAQTVEDVLEELLREYDRDDSELTNGEIIEMFAKRLTLAEGEDA